MHFLKVGTKWKFRNSDCWWWLWWAVWSDIKMWEMIQKSFYIFIRAFRYSASP